MADKPKKTLKFQMMMSPEEAEVLDDWMFKNRVRSRAEAIRRLCQMAMLVDRDIDDVVRRLAKATGLMSLVEEKWLQLLEDDESENDRNQYSVMVALLFAETFGPIEREAYDANNRLADLATQINALMQARDVPQGMEEMKLAHAKVRERLRQWHENHSSDYVFLSKDERKFNEIEDPIEALEFARELLDAWLPRKKESDEKKASA